MLYYRLRSTFDPEQPFAILLDGLLPLTHLYRVNAEFLTNLIDYVNAPKCLKTNYCFEVRAVDLPLLSFCHLASSLFRSTADTIVGIWGPHIVCMIFLMI
jgi:hypothetical protein